MAKKNSETNHAQSVSQDAIAQRAYEIWERDGRPEGRAAEHWFRAASELKAQTRGTERQGTPDKPAARAATPRVAENRFQPRG